MYGSARGALSNGRPYRNRREFITLLGGAAAWPLAAGRKELNSSALQLTRSVRVAFSKGLPVKTRTSSYTGGSA